MFLTGQIKKICSGQLEQKFAGMMYGMTSTKIPHFLQIAFPQRQFKVLIGQTQKKTISETTFLNGTLLCMNEVWKVLY